MRSLIYYHECKGPQENQKEDTDVGGRIILRWIPEKSDGVVWTGLSGSG
jgi:hypothetical protein